MVCFWSIRFDGLFRLPHPPVMNRWYGEVVPARAQSSHESVESYRTVGNFGGVVSGCWSLVAGKNQAKFF